MTKTNNSQPTQLSNSRSNFEDIKHINDGQEFWYARELMPLLGYARFDSFKRLITKVSEEIKVETKSFHNQVELLKIGENNPNPKEDYKLTRFACYKIAMLGNTEECIQARTYFAIQTRKQEIFEKELYDNKRLESRDKLTESRKNLRDEVYQRGIKTNYEFAGLEDNINFGLYTQNTKSIKKLKGIPDKKPLDNYTSPTELLAKSLSMEMTKINVDQKDLLGVYPIYKEGWENADEIRQSLVKRGIKPENLPPEEDIKKLQKQKNKKLITKQSKPKNLK